MKDKRSLDFICSIGLIAGLLFVGLKLSFIGRNISSVSKVYATWGYCLQDILMMTLFTVIAGINFKKYWAGIIPIFFVFSVNIIFITKTGYPMSASLFSQLGDLIFLQTSINSPSTVRNLYILIVAIGVFIVALGFIRFKIDLVSKLRKVVIPAYLAIVVLSLTSYLIPKHSYVSRFASNFFIALLMPPKTLDNLLKDEKFAGLKYEPWEIVGKSTELKSNNKNVVLLITETLSMAASEQATPFINNLKTRSTHYKSHFTPWPFSSKSLFSIMCTQPPFPGNIIEMKIHSQVPCHNWSGKLINNLGYRGFVGYTGNFSYDNMNNFFKGLGYQDLYDKNNLKLIGNYADNNLSIDDQSMVDQFKKWYKDKPSQPFVSVFITMNSHFPFWTPHDDFKKFDNDYDNAIFYQDKIAERIYKTLEESGALENTIFIVTGDHGKREAGQSSTIIPQMMFHVPLIIFESNKAPKVVNYPTSHYGLGSSIMNRLTGQQFGFKNFNLESSHDLFLSFEADQSLFSLINENESSVFSADGTIYKQKGRWPTSSSQTCKAKDCQTDLNRFFSVLKNLEGYYKL